MNQTKSNNHDWVLERTEAYLAGGLGSEDQVRLERHLTECEACREALEDVSSFSASVEKELSPGRPSPDLEDRMVNAIRVEMARPRSTAPSRRGRLLRFFKAASAISAALLLALIGTIVTDIQENKRPGSTLGIRTWGAKYSMAPMAERSMTTVGANNDVYLKETEILAPIDSPALAEGHGDSGVEMDDEAVASYFLKSEIESGADNYQLFSSSKKAGGLAATGDINGDFAGLAVDGTVGRDDFAWSADRELSVHEENERFSQITGELAQNSAPQPLGGTFRNKGRKSFDAKRPGNEPMDSISESGVGGGRFGTRAPDMEPPSDPAEFISESRDFLAVEKKSVEQQQWGQVEGEKNSGARGSYKNYFAMEDALARAEEDFSQKLNKARGEQSGGKNEEPLAQEGAGPGKVAPKPKAKQPEKPGIQRMIIRNGQLEYEVDSFDSSLTKIRQITQEEGGFIATVNSDKLENGKVRGTVIVRVPPQNLDTLVLKLRALGELKRQQIHSADVTKEYTDKDSELRAARAMEERLLDIIKNREGEVKDILAVEKELAQWRTKIEKIEGELRYMRNLVSLSTLTLTLIEKDIRQAHVAKRTEKATMGIETETVEDSYKEAQVAVEELKGRILSAELKRHDAGQLQALVHCEVEAEHFGTLLDRFRQLGNVTRLDVQRDETTEGGEEFPRNPDLPVKQAPSRIRLSLYNLANIAPRESIQMSIASKDVAAAVRAIEAAVTKAGGKVLQSDINDQEKDRATGSVNIDVPTGSEDTILVAIKAQGELLRQTVRVNPDTQNSTDRKKGLRVQVLGLGSVSPAETTTLTIVCADVESAFQDAVDRAREAGARIVTSQMGSQNAGYETGTLYLDANAEDADAILQFVESLGESVSKNRSEAGGGGYILESRRGLNVQIMGMARYSARENTTIQLAAEDVEGTYERILTEVRDRSGRIVSAYLDRKNDANISGNLDVEVLRSELSAIESLINGSGSIFSRVSQRQDASAASAIDSKVRLSLRIFDVKLIPPRELAQMRMEVGDVEKAYSDILAAAGSIERAHVTRQNLNRQQDGRILANIVVDVPLADFNAFLDQAASAGVVRVRENSRNEQIPENEVATGRLQLTLENSERVIPADEGIGASIKKSLQRGWGAVTMSVSFIITGLMFVGPWLLIGMGILWLFRRSRRASTATVGE